MRGHSFKVVSLFIFLAVFSLTACSTNRGNPTASLIPIENTDSFSPQSEDKVTLQETTINWNTYQYELTDNNGILPGSYDGVTKQGKTFNTWVLENKYLKVTLLPEMGGRIISMIYKPAGHEELYQNPVGVPYQICLKIKAIILLSTLFFF